MGFSSNSFTVSTKAITANSQFGAFGVVMRLLNAGLTFGFGYAFGATTFDTGSPELSAILGGVAYMVILDVAAFGWDAAALRKGISPEQRAIADGMSAVSMWSSTIISAVQLLLTTTLVTVPPGMRNSVGMLALILITVLLGAHFIRLFGYQRLSPEAVDSRIESELASTLSNMKQQYKQRQAINITTRVAERLTMEMDRLADLEADKALEHMLIEMGHGDQVARPQVQGKDEGKADPAPPSPPKVEPEDAHLDTENVAGQDIIDLDELKGNARAAQNQNLNMAAG